MTKNENIFLNYINKNKNYYHIKKYVYFPNSIMFEIMFLIISALKLVYPNNYFI